MYIHTQVLSPTPVVRISLFLTKTAFLIIRFFFNRTKKKSTS